MGAGKTSGGQGWADVAKLGYFGWEYKGKDHDLDKAYAQLLLYRDALQNPPASRACKRNNGGSEIVYTFNDTLNTIHQYPVAVSPEMIGAAKAPGMPFVGGSQLVIWKHSLMELDAMELISFLTSPNYQKMQQPIVGDLSVLHEVLADDPYRSKRRYKVSAESLRSGRTIQPVPHWAAVETRLTALLQQLWKDVFRGISR